MKKIILFLLMVLILGCGKTIEVKPEKVIEKKEVILKKKMPLLITKADEFIDLDSNSIKFLFNTNKGATVKFYLGESKNNLLLREEKVNYTIKRRLKISGLEEGKTYFYKIESSLKNKTVESEINSFTKINRELYTDRAEWARTAIFYQIFVRSFYDTNEDGIGDFKGITKKIDYLKELGVDALWLMPPLKSPSYHGYDVEDYYAVEPDYGNMEDFEELLKVSEENGIKIIIDLVLNHSSSETFWFKEALKGKENKYRDYYVWADDFTDISEGGAWDQKIWNVINEKNAYMSVFVSEMPDWNLRNEEVRTLLKDIAKFWIEKGVDGFRLDASLHIDDKDVEVTHNWWQDFHKYVKEVNPDTYLVGECWHWDYAKVSPFFKDMDSSFNFALLRSIYDAANGKKTNIIEDINNMKSSFSKYSDKYIDAIFISNHDIDRPLKSVKYKRDREKLAGALLLTLPGTPFIYYGNEIGQKGNDDQVRTPFEWYKSNTGEGMTTWRKTGLSKPDDGISVEEQMENDESIYNFYKKLIKIRKENPVLFNGSYKEIQFGDGILGYEVYNEKTKLLVVHNLSKELKEVDLVNYKNAKEILIEKPINSDKILLDKKSTIIFKIK